MDSPGWHPLHSPNQCVACAWKTATIEKKCLSDHKADEEAGSAPVEQDPVKETMEVVCKKLGNLLKTVTNFVVRLC